MPNIGPYVYTEATPQQILITISTYRWLQSTTQTLNLTSNLFPYKWRPSQIQSVNIGEASTLFSPIKNRVYNNRTVNVAASYPTPVKQKASLQDIPYENMEYVLSDTAQTFVDTTITLPEDHDSEETLYLKTQFENDTPAPFASILEFQIKTNPIGKDTKKLLRGRKFYNSQKLARWDGKQFKDK